MWAPHVSELHEKYVQLELARMERSELEMHLSIVRQIQHLLGDRSRWTTHSLARTVVGRTVPPRSRIALRWCLVGAVERIYRGPGGGIGTYDPLYVSGLDLISVSCVALTGHNPINVNDYGGHGPVMACLSYTESCLVDRLAELDKTADLPAVKKVPVSV